MGYTITEKPYHRVQTLKPFLVIYMAIFCLEYTIGCVTWNKPNGKYAKKWPTDLKWRSLAVKVTKNKNATGTLVLNKRLHALSGVAVSNVIEPLRLVCNTRLMAMRDKRWKQRTNGGPNNHNLIQRRAQGSIIDNTDTGSWIYRILSPRIQDT